VELLFEKTQNFRLIMVDDFSDVETSAYLMGVLQRQPISLYIRTAQQKWFTRASNLGLRMVRTPRVVLLNSDCVPEQNWLQELYDVWEDVETSTKQLVGLVGSVQSAEEPRRWAVSVEPGYVTGHAVLYAMDALSKISQNRGQEGWYLDEVSQGAIHINSDRFACYEMNRMGLATVAAYKSAVGHHGGKSWGYNLTRINHLRVGDPLKGEVFG
jgi:glycosyltransferase involved in cell wall biosynthesis